MGELVCGLFRHADSSSISASLRPPRMTITSDVLEAYLKCPTKCWLRSSGEPSAGATYPEWVKAQNDSYQDRSSTPAENIRIKQVGPRSCGTTPAWQDIDHYFLRKGFTVHKFIEEGRRLVTFADLHALSFHCDRLFNKLEQINPSYYPGLDLAVHTIVLVLKSARAKSAVALAKQTELAKIVILPCF
jgi:hypothetical protein